MHCWLLSGTIRNHGNESHLNNFSFFAAMLCSSSASLTDMDQATLRAKLQALVYDILPSTTAVFSYAIGSRKLSVS